MVPDIDPLQSPGTMWTVRTLASYFILGSIAMVAGARSTSKPTRRFLARAFIGVGVVHLGSTVPLVLAGGDGQMDRVIGTIIADLGVMGSYLGMIWLGYE